MYSEHNRRSASRRADDEFLRRMIGGELAGEQSSTARASGCRQSNPTPLLSEHKPPCNSSQRMEEPTLANPCPATIPAPSLAMVYAPKQCWRNLLSPTSALAQGSLFAELVQPLEAVGSGNCKIKGQEVKTCRPF